MLNEICNFTITVSFKDKFSDLPRVFIIRYHGRIDIDGIGCRGSRELGVSEPEYQANKKAFEHFNNAM